MQVFITRLHLFYIRVKFRQFDPPNEILSQGKISQKAFKVCNTDYYK